MKRIDMNHWFLEENKLNISLSKLFASIETSLSDGEISWYLTVTNNRCEEIAFKFDTLEDVVSFVEDEISRCYSVYEVINMYKEVTRKYEKREIIPKKNKVFLSPEDVDMAILRYCLPSSNFSISIFNKLTINNNQPEISYYVTESMNVDGVMKRKEKCLTHDELTEIFSDFVGDLNYDLVNFKYCGGIHRVGYYIDEPTPYFEGIELNVKEKNKNKVLSKTRD